MNCVRGHLDVLGWDVQAYRIDGADLIRAAHTATTATTVRAAVLAVAIRNTVAVVQADIPFTARLALATAKLPAGFKFALASTCLALLVGFADSAKAAATVVPAVFAVTTCKLALPGYALVAAAGTLATFPTTTIVPTFLAVTVRLTEALFLARPVRAAFLSVRTLANPVTTVVLAAFACTIGLATVVAVLRADVAVFSRLARAVGAASCLPLAGDRVAAISFGEADIALFSRLHRSVAAN